MAVPSLPSKSDLRHQALAARRAYARALTDDARAAQGAALAERVLPHLVTAGVIAAYHPLRDEISPLQIVMRLGAGQRPAFPWFAARDARMIFRDGPADTASPWTVMQPSADAEALAPDLVLVPLVLADRRGTRIGHGKGHYDRALAHLRESGHPVTTIGLAWDLQISEEALPADPWDAPLDAIATPGEWIRCSP